MFARREETPFHRDAVRLLREFATGSEPWAIPWPCIYEFLRVVTDPRVFDPPTPLDAALEDLGRLLESPSLSLLGEGPAHPSHLTRTLRTGEVSGNLVHDGHIAALCIEHGVRVLLTADRDFTRFAPLKVRNPFAG